MNKIILIMFMFSFYFLNKANAENISEENAMELVAKQNMKGWNGMVFSCFHDENILVTKTICNRAKQDFELLAIKNQVSYSITKNNNYFDQALKSTDNNHIKLSVNLLTTTTDPGSFRGFFAEIKLTEYFQSAQDSNKKNNNTRNGSISLNQNTVIATGIDSEITGPFGDAIEQNIANMVLHLMKYGDSWRN